MEVGIPGLNALYQCASVVSNYNIHRNSPALTFLGKGAVLSLLPPARHNGIAILWRLESDKHRSK